MLSAFVVAGGQRLEYSWYGAASPGRAPIVMLHEGLGSVAQWRDFPQRLAAASRRRVLAYSRLGYGQSDPLTAPRGVDFMHAEALHVLPELLDRLGVARPILCGHSDGASIALIHAARAQRPVLALIVLAPHVFVEPCAVRRIAATRLDYLDGDLRQRLSRFHHHVDGAFWGWNDIWLKPQFASWSIEALLPRIDCPLLAVQGEDDEYGTMEQIDRLQAAMRGAQRLVLRACGHAPHRDQAQAVLAAVAAFVAPLA